MIYLSEMNFDEIRSSSQKLNFYYNLNIPLVLNNCRLLEQFSTRQLKTANDTSFDENEN